jgi:hypothetical protein
MLLSPFCCRKRRRLGHGGGGRGQLIDHLIAGERDADQDELHGLIAYCHERLALLNGPDADFILSMKGIVKRYAMTPRHRRWAPDIVHRLLLSERESTKDRGLRFTH